MSRAYYNLTKLAAAAKAQDCKAHLHIDGFGTPIFSIGNENTGAREFSDFGEAMDFLNASSTASAEAHQCPADYQTESKRAKQGTIVEFNRLPKRPTIGNLSDVLREVAKHEPAGFTRISGYSEAWWHGVGEGEPDRLELRMSGATACFEDTNAVVIFVRQGVPVAKARALLKAAARELKSYPSLECSTPLVPVAEQDLPF